MPTAVLPPLPSPASSHSPQVIPLDERGGMGEAFNMRLDELKVVDLAFLGERCWRALLRARSSCLHCVWS